MSYNMETHTHTDQVRVLYDKGIGSKIKGKKISLSLFRYENQRCLSDNGGGGGSNNRERDASLKMCARRRRNGSFLDEIRHGPGRKFPITRQDGCDLLLILLLFFWVHTEIERIVCASHFDGDQ